MSAALPPACISYQACMKGRNAIAIHECPFVEKSKVLSWLHALRETIKEGDLIVFYKWMSQSFQKGPAGAWDLFLSNKCPIKCRTFPVQDNWDIAVFRVDEFTNDMYWGWSE